MTYLTQAVLFVAMIAVSAVAGQEKKTEERSADVQVRWTTGVGYSEVEIPGIWDFHVAGQGVADKISVEARRDGIFISGVEGITIKGYDPGDGWRRTLKIKSVREEKTGKHTVEVSVPAPQTWKLTRFHVAAK